MDKSIQVVDEELMDKAIYPPRDFTGLPATVPLNPVQTEVWNLVAEREKHMLVIANTSTGKTVCFRIMATKYLFPVMPEDKGIVVYVAPLKALVEEKKRDWTNPNDPYANLKLSVVTGDYRTGDDAQLENSDIILITPESLASRLRNASSKKSSFISKIKLLCCDEIHLIGEEGRGANLEAALVEFAHDNKDAQIMGLSGTVPNATDLLAWFQKLSPHKETILINRTDWRPIKVHQYFHQFYETQTAPSEAERIRMVISDLKANPNDQHLICVFKKAFGYKMQEAIEKEGIPINFHCADKTFSERKQMEEGFELGAVQNLICTKTLFAGVNLPAERVICTHVEAGGSDVHYAELKQIEGRSGRPQYGKEGHCTYYVPSGSANYHQQRILNGETVVSQLKKTTIALHFLGCVLRKKITCLDDFIEWYKRTLAHTQRMETDAEVQLFCEGVIADMIKFSMLTVDDNNHTMTLKRRGIISAQMGVDPYNLAILSMNLNKYFSYTAPTDIDLAIAIGSIPMYESFFNANESSSDIPITIKRGVTNSYYYKSCTVIFNMLKGLAMPQSLKGMAYNVRDDIERLCVCIDRLDAEVERWGEDKFAASLAYRMLHGVSWEEGWLIHQGCSKSEAKRLNSAGFTDLNQPGASDAMSVGKLRKYGKQK